MQAFAHGGFFVALLQKEPDTGLQNPVLRGETHVRICQKHPSSRLGI